MRRRPPSIPVHIRAANLPDADDWLGDFADRLIEVRRRLSLSQAQLAAVLNISQSHLCEVETRKSQPGSRLLVALLALDFDLPKIGDVLLESVGTFVISRNWLLFGYGPPFEQMTCLVAFGTPAERTER